VYNVKCAAVFEVLPKKSIVFCPVTSLRMQSCLYLRERDRGREEDLCPEKKFYDSMSTAVIESEVLKNAKQCAFMPTPSKKAKKCQTRTYMQNTTFSCQTTTKKAKFLEFGLKNADLAVLVQVDCVPSSESKTENCMP